MNYIRILHSLPEFRSQRIILSRVKTGGTNIKYFVFTKKGNYVARFLGAQQERFLQLNRPREIYNTKLAYKKGIGPKVIAYYPQYGLLILEYIKGRVLRKYNLRRRSCLSKIVKILRALHSGLPFEGKFDVLASIEYYLRIIKSDGKKMPLLNSASWQKYELAKKTIKERKFRLSPCHIDLMHLNFIENNGKLKMIDWEYSAMSDPLFDLAFLSAQGRLRARDDVYLLNKYFGKIDAKLMCEFKAMKTLFYLREGLWSLVQLGRSDLPFDYQSYTKKNFKWFNQFNLD